MQQTLARRDLKVIGRCIYGRLCNDLTHWLSRQVGHIAKIDRDTDPIWLHYQMNAGVI